MVTDATGLSQHPKADTMLHQATDIAEIILLELELIEGRTAEPDLDRSLKRVEGLVLKQTQLIAGTRKQLQNVALTDTETFKN